MDESYLGQVALRMESVSSAAEQLATAGRELAALLRAGKPQELPVLVIEEVPAPREWHSPVLDARAVQVDGETDLEAALERGDPRLVFDGEGGLVDQPLSPEMRVVLLARASAGDVALEVAHARWGGDQEAIDRLLTAAFAKASEQATEMGQPVPRDEFIQALTLYPEIEARGSAWR